jgi:hypothetical protein
VTFGAIALWVLSQLATGWVMDRIAPLPDPDQVSQAQDIASPLALLVTVAIRLLGVGVQLAVFCALPLPALYGMAWICVRASRGHPVSASDMLGPLRRIGSFAGVVVLLTIAVAIPFALWALAIVVAGVIITIAVPFVLASLWIQCRWIYAPLAVADGMGVREAMRASWRITRTGRALVWTRIAGAMLGWAIAGIAMMVLPLAWIGLPRVAAYFASGYALGLSAAQSGHAGSAHGSQ